jgi:hypothetical protein
MKRKGPSGIDFVPELYSQGCVVSGQWLALVNISLLQAFLFSIELGLKIRKSSRRILRLIYQTNKT